MKNLLSELFKLFVPKKKKTTQGTVHPSYPYIKLPEDRGIKNVTEPINKGRNRTEEFKRLQSQIEVAEECGEPIEALVKAQIRLLEESHDEFIATALAEGYSLDNYRVAMIEVEQYRGMRQLALKIGLSPEKYDRQIKHVQIRVFGEENYKLFFEKNNQHPSV